MKTKENLKTTIIKLLLFLNTISTIGVPCLGHYIDHISIYYFILNIFSFVLILMFRSKIKITGFFKFILLYYIILIASTIVNKGDIFLLLCETASTLTMILLWNSLYKNEVKQYISVLSLCIEIMAYLNLFLVIEFPDGIYNIGMSRKYYLFDHVNVAIRYLLPGCTFMLIRSYLNKNKVDIRSYAYILVVALTLIITWPATAVIGFLIFIIGIKFIYTNKNMNQLLSPVTATAVAGTISYMLIIVKIQNYFSNFITNVLHRDVTFTGRTNIWDKAIYYIQNKLFLGNGRLTSLEREEYLGVTSAHNQFLNFLFEGGIFLLVVIIVTIIAVSNKIKKCNNLKIVSVLLATTLSYVFMWISEPFSYSGTALMFMVWLFMYRSPELFNIEKKQDGGKRDQFGKS